MIDFPETTHVHRRLPKEAFYQHLPLTNTLKEKFVSDVDRIYVEWSLTKNNLHLERDGNIKEILILLIDLKKQAFDAKIIEAIARQNPHELVFILEYEDKQQLAIFHGKLYRSQWMNKDKVVLAAKGFSLDEIMDGLIEQAALTEESGRREDLSIDDRLARQEQIDKLQKRIEKTEAAAWKEQQPKKRFELYSQVQEYKRTMKELIDNE